MRCAIFGLMLLASSASAQVSVGAGVSLSGMSIGTPVSPGSSVIGMDSGDFNLNASELANILEAMRFTYSQFAQQAPITNGTADACSVVSGSTIYVVGGYAASANAPINNMQIYNAATNTWSQGATIPTAEWGAACALYNGKIYVFGGVASSSETPTNNAFVYNISGDSWSSLTVMPSSIADGIRAVTVGNVIYILYESTFWKFDPAGAAGMGSYANLTAPPSAAQVKWAATGYVNVSGDDRIYFIGGSNAATVYQNTNYYYSITNVAWSGAQATAPYTAHGQLGNALCNGSICYVGGYDGSVFYPTLYSYDPVGNSWTGALATLRAWRDGVAGGMVGNALYVMGGRNANAPNVFGMTADESFLLASSPAVSTFTKLQLNYTGSPSGNVHLGIYADSAGSPGSLILDAGPVAMATGWTVISGLSVSSLSVGTNYWLVFLGSTNGNSISYTSGSPAGSASGAHCAKTGVTYGALPSTFPVSGTTCQTGSMFAEKLTVN